MESLISKTTKIVACLRFWKRLRSKKLFNSFKKFWTKIESLKQENRTVVAGKTIVIIRRRTSTKKTGTIWNRLRIDSVKVAELHQMMIFRELIGTKFSKIRLVRDKIGPNCTPIILTLHQLKVSSKFKGYQCLIRVKWNEAEKTIKLKEESSCRSECIDYQTSTQSHSRLSR